MQGNITGKYMQEMASAIVSLSEHALKVAIVNDNYDAGILTNLLVKAQWVHKKRIAHIDYYTSKAFPTPEECDIAIVSSMSSLQEFSIVPPPSCTEVFLVQQDIGTIKTTCLNIADRMEGTAIKLQLS